MNSDMLTQFLIDITRGRLREAYASAPQETLAAAPLSDAQRALISGADIAGLFSAGTNPMVLLTFARQCGWSMERYYACVTEAPAAKRNESMLA